MHSCCDRRATSSPLGFVHLAVRRRAARAPRQEHDASSVFLLRKWIAHIILSMRPCLAIKYGIHWQVMAPGRTDTLVCPVQYRHHADGQAGVPVLLKLAA